MQTIMVVDSEVGVHDMVRGAMQGSNMEVLSACDSRSALVLLEGASCDLMLVESTMPVSRESVLVPIQPGDRYQKVCSESFLKKPFTENELVDFVSQHLE